jgi:hypothetical protein
MCFISSNKLPYLFLDFEQKNWLLCSEWKLKPAVAWNLFNLVIFPLELQWNFVYVT